MRLIAKIGDFGLSTRQYFNLKQRAVEVVTWVAPEILQCQGYTEASDVYSFALVAYELITQSIPYSEKSFSFWSQLEELVIKGYRPPLDLVAQRVPALAKLLPLWWHANPLDRPSFFTIKMQLFTVIHALNPTLYTWLRQRETDSMAANQENRATTPIVRRNTPPLIRVESNLGAPSPLQRMPSMQSLSNEVDSANATHSDVSDGVVIGRCAKRLHSSSVGLAGVTAIAQVDHEVWTGHYDGLLAVWSVDNGQLERRYTSQHTGPIKAIVCQLDEQREIRHIWTGSKDGVLVVWHPALSIADRLALTESERRILADGRLRVGDSSQPAKYYVLRIGDYNFHKVVLVGASVRAVEAGSHLAPTNSKYSAFVLASSLGTEFVFVCKTEAKRDKWVAALTIAIAHFVQENNVRTFTRGTGVTP
mgnify:FL=1